MVWGLPKMKRFGVLSLLLILVLAGGVNALNAESNIDPAQGLSHRDSFTIVINFELEDDEERDNFQNLFVVYDEGASDDEIEVVDNRVGFNIGNNGRASVTINGRVKEFKPAGLYSVVFRVEGENGAELPDVNGLGPIEVRVEEEKEFKVEFVDDQGAVITLSRAILEDDSNRDLKIKVTNTGNVNFAAANNIKAKYVGDNEQESNILSDGDRKIRFTYPNNDNGGFNVAPGQLHTVNVKVSVDRGVDLGDYKGKFQFQTGQGQNALVRELNFDVLVGDNLCDQGAVGNNLKVSIKDPDSGDTYKPGDKIQLEVEVENDGNDDMDVIVEASLVNLDEGKKIDSEKTNDEKVDEGDERRFDIELVIDPEDVDDGDELMIFVKAYEDRKEDENCIEETLDLEVEKDDDDVRVTGISVLPRVLMCGQSGEVAVQVENFGKDDQDVRVKLFNRDLKIDTETASFEIEEGKRDNEAVVRFRVEVPEGTESKEYQLEARALFSGKDFSAFAPLTVTCSAEEPEEAEDKIRDVGVSTPSVNDLESAEAETVPLTGQTIFDKFNSTRETPIALWVMADLILVLIIVFIISLILKRR